MNRDTRKADALSLPPAPGRRLAAAFRPMALLLLLAALGMAASPAVGQAVEFSLHPPAALQAKVAGSEAPTPFTQAVPFEQGRLSPGAVGHVAVDGEPLDAIARPMTYWPDGSVRLLLVDGVVPPALLDGRPLSASLVRQAPQPAARNPVRRLEAADDGLVFRGEDGAALATLSLEAAWSPVTKEKIMYPDDRHLNDAVAQYGWAHPLGDLAEDGAPRPLRPRARETEVEAENAVFTDYVIRGDCGDSAPGDALEWQLRARVYRSTPVVRWQMTWKMLWDVDDHALARAAWVLRPADGIQSAVIPNEHGGSTGLRVARGDASMRFAPDGYGVLTAIRDDVLQTHRPDDRWHRLVTRSGGLRIGVAACDLSRLGPSHISVDTEALEVASWSDMDGLGMDLRSSTTPDEAGIGGGDLTADGQGVAFSLDGALVFTEREADAEALTLAEVTREHLWFASASDWYRTGALGDRVNPDTVGAGDDTARRLRGTQESAYFLIHSRDYWRWYGALNYGDVRTNFKGIRDARGRYFDRWGLHGRYGWRNGSSDAHGRMLYFGLLMEDRAVTLAGLDYARHVADVDVKHGSFFRAPEGEEGGMHRRNKDHWSGGVEPQYTTSRGLYMASWLTGDRRTGEVLEEVRAFCKNIGRQSSSAFRAAAWIHRYAETRDEQDLAVARQLIDACAEQWASREARDDLDGLSAIYRGNFRRVGDGLLTLVDFHQHTGEREYLEAILKSVRHHGVRSYDDSYLVAYLLQSGVPEAEIGEELLEDARRRAPSPGDSGPDAQPKSEWTYDILRDKLTSNRASYNVGRALRYIPFSTAVFHGQER